jgi:hypothetical protein
MRVALCISGQPRKAMETFPYIYDNIIGPNNADVFIHMNFDKENTRIEKLHMDNGTCDLDPDIDQKVIDLYKPVKYLIESPKNFHKPNLEVPEKRIENVMKMNAHRKWDREQTKNHIIKQLMSMYYSIYKCNELKETYANENGFVYDYVIRLRFDFVPYAPLYCNKLNPNFIHYLGIQQKDELISDWLNIGSNSIMNIYASLYLHVEYLNTFKFYKKNQRISNTLEPSDICGGYHEHMLRDIMHLHRIPKNAIHLSHALLY